MSKLIRLSLLLQPTPPHSGLRTSPLMRFSFATKSFCKTKSDFPFASLEPFSDFKNVQVYFRSDANRIHRHGSLFTALQVGGKILFSNSVRSWRMKGKVAPAALQQELEDFEDFRQNPTGSRLQSHHSQSLQRADSDFLCVKFVKIHTLMNSDITKTLLSKAAPRISLPAQNHCNDRADCDCVRFG